MPVVWRGVLDSPRRSTGGLVGQPEDVAEGPVFDVHHVALAQRRFEDVGGALEPVHEEGAGLDRVGEACADAVAGHIVDEREGVGLEVDVAGGAAVVRVRRHLRQPVLHPLAPDGVDPVAGIDRREGVSEPQAATGGRNMFGG